MKLESVPSANKSVDLAVGVLQIAEGQSPGLAGVDTGWRGLTVDTCSIALGHSCINSFQAKIALFGGTCNMRIELFSCFLEASLFEAREITGVFVLGEKSAVLIGAGQNTVAAADALGIVHVYYAIIPLDRGLCGTDIDAGGLLALVATDRHSGKLLAREGSFPGD